MNLFCKVLKCLQLASLLGALLFLPIAAWADTLTFKATPIPAVPSGTLTSAQAAALSAQLTTQSAQLSTQSAQISALSTAVAGKQTKVVFNARDYGAVGDGVTPDSDHLNAAITAAHAVGGTVWVPPTLRGYLLHSGVDSRASLHMLPGVNLKGDHTRLILGQFNQNFIDNSSSITATAMLTAAPTVGQTTFSVNSTAGITAGNEVLVELGQSTYDTGEPASFYFAQVVSVTSNTVTLDRPNAYSYAGLTSPYDFASVQTQYPNHNSINVISNFCHDFSVDGFDLDNPPAPNGSLVNSCTAGLSMNYVQNASYSNISGENTGPCLVGGQYDENVDVLNTSCRMTIADHPSYGNMFSWAECTNVSIINASCANFQNHFIQAESGSTITMTGAKVVNNWPGQYPANPARSNNNTPEIVVLGNAKMTVQGLRLEGNRSYFWDQSANSSDQSLDIQNLNSQATDFPIITDASILSGRVTINSGFLAGKTLTDTKEVSISKTLNTSAQTQFNLPTGLIKSIRAYVSAAPTGAACYWGGNLNNLSGTFLSQLVPGQTVRIGGVGIGSGYTVPTGSGTTLYVYPGSSLPAGIVLTLDVVYWPISGVDDGTHGLTTIPE